MRHVVHARAVSLHAARVAPLLKQKLNICCSSVLNSYLLSHIPCSLLNVMLLPGDSAALPRPPAREGEVAEADSQASRPPRHVSCGGDLLRDLHD